MRTKPIRVLVANAPEEIGGVTCWRMFWPLRALEQSPEFSGAFDIRFSRGVIFPFDFYQTDVLLCFRPSKPEHLAVIQEAKRVGCKIVLDYDDNHRDVSTGHPAFWSLGQSWNIAKQACALANLIWVSTENLKQVYGHQSKTEVIPNAVYPEQIPDQPQDYANRVGVWAGSDAHREDCDAYQILYKKLLSRLSRFYWINFAPGWAKQVEDKCRVDLLPWQHTETYFDFLREIGTTVIWKPLQKNKFNDGKSNIAWITATLAGGVCISTYAGEPGWEGSLKEYPNKAQFLETWEKSAALIREKYNLNDTTTQRAVSLLKLVK